jgi:hypothetical protein
MISDPYFSTKRCVQRLVANYEQNKNLIIGIDFDDTVFDFHKKGYRYYQVIDLLQECSECSDKLTLVLLTTEPDPEKLKWKAQYCQNLDINISYINDSPVMRGAGKVFVNILLDDRAGLKQAYDILKQTLKIIKRKN